MTTRVDEKVTIVKERAATRGPFLEWPVSRREFYRTICWALVPALMWGVIVFGSRALEMVVTGVLATTLMHVVLKRGLKWKRAKNLLYVHCLASVLVLVGLAHPTWPVWITTVLAAGLPPLLALLGGPGRERVHVAVAAVLVAQYVVLPAMGTRTYTGKGDAILARDRLVMGDIRDQERGSTAQHWPSSLELSGNDAVEFRPPSQVAAETLDKVSSSLPSFSKEGRGVGLEEERRIREILARTFTFELPDMGLFMAGMGPNRVGAASLIAITAAGLYLSYRYILRPRSVLFFLITFIVATACFTFTPQTIQRVGLPVVWEVLAKCPGEIMTLFNYLLLNSDAGFAAVFVLALPGTEPLTARGRRIFLVCAAVGAAGLHRLDPGAPAATLMLCVLMPVTWVFDRVLGQRSWLNGGGEAKG